MGLRYFDGPTVVQSGLPTGRVFLANVGANASHRLTSPLRPDGSFTLVSIPEDCDLQGERLVRYGQVPHLREAVPERFWTRATHYDPEFETLTYGDNCGRAARAVALKSCLPGDWIVFIARLVGATGPIFALVGMLEIEGILKDVRSHPGPEDIGRYGSNAHIRRATADPRLWDGFWVFAGTPRSGLFETAVQIARPEAEVLLRDRLGGLWEWRQDRSELQTIGSYTRSCRCIIDPAREPDRHKRFWELVSRGYVRKPLP